MFIAGMRRYLKIKNSGSKKPLNENCENLRTSIFILSILMSISILCLPFIDGLSNSWSPQSRDSVKTDFKIVLNNNMKELN